MKQAKPAAAFGAYINRSIFWCGLCRQRPGCGKAAAALATALRRRRYIWIERRLLSTGQTDGRTDTRPLHRPYIAYCGCWQRQNVKCCQQCFVFDMPSDLWQNVQKHLTENLLNSCARVVKFSLFCLLVCCCCIFMLLLPCFGRNKDIRVIVPGAARRYAPSQMAVRLATDLRPPSVDGSAVRTSLVAGQLQAASVPIAGS